MRTAHKGQFEAGWIQESSLTSNDGEENFSVSRKSEAMPLEAYMALSNSLASERELVSDALPHQAVVLRDIQSHLRQGSKEGYIELATSTGKTYLIAKLTEAFHRAGLRTLILAPQIVIAEQIVNNPDRGLARFAQGISKQDIGKHYGGYQATSHDTVVVSTYASLNTFVETAELGDFDVILADEAHRSLGNVTKKNLLAFSPQAIKLGFTATPEYGIDKHVNEIFAKPMHSITLPEAIEMGLVAPVQCLVYTTDAEIPYIDPQGEFTQKEIERLMHLKARNEQAVEFAKNFAADGRQGIIACVPGGSLAHARMLAQDINNQVVRTKDGSRKIIRASAVGSHQSREERSKILSQFEKGYIDVLTFVSNLSEGWDSQRASFLINTCPTTSKVKITQLIGRVLRKKPGGLESLVVDFLDQSQRKVQATALAALGEERFVLGHVIGGRSGTSISEAERRTYLQGILSPELWYNLQAANSKLLSELNISALALSPEEQLIAQYERLLAKEGLPAEPRTSLNVPKSVIVEIERFKRSFYRRNRVEPTVEDIEAFIQAKLPGSRTMSDHLARLALQGYEALDIDLNDYDIEEGRSEDRTDAVIDYIARTAILRSGLNALPERERRILEMRFGFEGEPWTFEAIGQELDLTRERVRQLESQAFVRLSSLKTLDAYFLADQTPRERLKSKVRLEIRWLDEGIEKARSRVADAKTGKIVLPGNLDPEAKERKIKEVIEENIYAEYLSIFTKMLQDQYLIYISSQEVFNVSPAAVDINTRLVSDRIDSHMLKSGGTGHSPEIQRRFKIHWMAHMVQNLKETIGISSRLHVPLESKDLFYGWIERVVNEATQQYKFPGDLIKF